MKSVNIKIAIIVVLLAVAGNSMAQEEKSLWLKNKIDVGGNFAFNVGNRTGVVELSPTFSIRLMPKLTTSLDIICQYSWDNKYSISKFSYGLGLSARYTIIDNMYVYAQYTYNPYILTNELTDEKTRGVYTGFWIGGGYTKRINDNVTVYTGIIYNVLAGPDADDNPRISGGVSYNL